MAYPLGTVSENRTFGLLIKEQNMSSQATKRSAFTVLQSNVNFKQRHNDVKMKQKTEENLFENRKVQSTSCEFRNPSFTIFSEETEKHEKIIEKKHLGENFEEEKENLQLHNIPDYVARLNTLNDCPNNTDSKLNESDLSSVFDLTFSETTSIKSPNKPRKTDNESDSPYSNDIYLYLREVEQKLHPRAAYMKKQPDITLSMRSVLVDWLVEVGEEYKLQGETLYLAISYIDRFLSSMSVLRGKLQLVGTACMFIAAKYEEIYPPELKDFVYITDDTYSKKQVLRMEHLILKVLEFNLSTPTAHTFLSFFCNMSRTTGKVGYLSQYICELSLLEAEPFLKYLPSEIAAGSLILANYTLGFNPWNEDFKTMTGYKLQDLIPVTTSLYSRYKDIAKYPQQSISEKYKSSRFQRVSNIQPPEELINSMML